MASIDTAGLFWAVSGDGLMALGCANLEIGSTRSQFWVVVYTMGLQFFSNVVCHSPRRAFATSAQATSFSGTSIFVMHTIELSSKFSLSSLGSETLKRNFEPYFSTSGQAGNLGIPDTSQGSDCRRLRDCIVMARSGSIVARWDMTWPEPCSIREPNQHCSTLLS